MAATVWVLSWELLCGLALISAAQLTDADVLHDFQSVRQPGLVGLEFVKLLKDRPINASDIIGPKVPTQEDLLCLSDMTQFLTALKTGEYWALKMIDAWGAIPSGLLTGNSYDLGNFDECLNVRKEISAARTIRGKYCFLSAPLGKALGVDDSLSGFFSIKTATCFPASCSAAHLNTLVGQVMNQLVNSSLTGMSIIESSCQTSESESWDGLTIFTVYQLVYILKNYNNRKLSDKLPVVVTVFSARANSRSLFRVVENNRNPNVIECLHGIRCMSLFWVVFSHEYKFTVIAANINEFQLIKWLELPFTSFIAHGFFSVDSFFFLGGLLVSLIALRSMEKTNGKLNVPMMYLYRLFRIFPLLAVAILVYTKLMTVVTDGPLLQGGYSGKAACESGWYWTLMFLNNYKNEECLSHTWYLSVDMQMFILSPIMLIALYKWGKKAAAGIFVLIVLLSGCLFATMMVNNYSMLMKTFSQEAMNKMYSATHTHATPWLIGFLFGYFLYLNRGREFHLKRVSVWSGWILCLAMIFTSIFALYPAAQSSAPPLSTLAESFYYTLTRVGWPLALCWVVFACMQGYGGLANSFLSSPLWQPLSRLSYSVYMWHKFIQEINTRSARTNSYFSDYQVMLKFWSTLGVTLLLSYMMYLLIEAPFGGLPYFLRRPKAKTVSQVKPDLDKADKNQKDDSMISQQSVAETITSD
ncbi:hypothetical protein KR059_012046 [Drosophila kikkawai]|nr:hypothetical protein KR059_012046 [Drosophila kikkawai]